MQNALAFEARHQFVAVTPSMHNIHAEPEVAARPGKSKVESVALPAQHWMKLADAYSAHMLVEHTSRTKLATVRVTEYQGLIYTTTGVLWGGIPGPCETISYRLVPLSLYQGETWRFAGDLVALYDNGRERGDQTGLIVSIKGSPMVLAQRVKFVRKLPTCTALPISEAVKYSRSSSATGWRAIFFSDAEVQWGLYQGHPASRHTKPNGEVRQMIYWKHEGHVQEIFLEPSEPFEPLPEGILAPAPQKVIPEPTQLGLF